MIEVIDLNMIHSCHDTNALQYSMRLRDNLALEFVRKKSLFVYHSFEWQGMFKIQLQTFSILNIYLTP